MSGLPEVVVTAVRDPLVVALGIFALGGLLMHILFRHHPLGRATVRVVFLVVLTLVLWHAGVVPYERLTVTGVLFEDAVHAVLKIAWWLWTAWFAVGLLRAFVVSERRPREGKLVQDLLAGLVYLAAVFAIIANVFDLPIRGLLATSGAVAIILGLALQSTLSDVFSGIVLNFSRPYRPGDWISIEGGTDGSVIEMNWRATHILTGKSDLAIVPNSTIAKAKIVNSSSPSGVHGMTVTVRLDAKNPPSTGAEILRRAVLNTRLILTTPAPAVVVTSIIADAIEFDINFSVEQLAHGTRAQNELFNWIYRHLAVAGIGWASSQRQLAAVPPAASREQANTAVERAIDLVAIFADLTEDERKMLAAKTRHVHYDQGEVLIELGTVLRSLFVIGAGIVSITAATSEGETELLRIGPGDHYGEIGMLTGQPAAATLKALIPVTAYELAREDLAPVLEARPEVSQELSRALAQRQAAGQLIAAAGIDTNVPLQRAAAWFSERLRRLFDVADVN
jgi:small-conductance mechanosensitive channel/CRP-like cAMP-binding protein